MHLLSSSDDEEASPVSRCSTSLSLIQPDDIIDQNNYSSPSTLSILQDIPSIPLPSNLTINSLDPFSPQLPSTSKDNHSSSTSFFRPQRKTRTQFKQQIIYTGPVLKPLLAVSKKRSQKQYQLFINGRKVDSNIARK